MDNQVKFDDFFNDMDNLFLPIEGYQCIWCGHEQPNDGICDYCGSYALEPYSKETE